MSWDTGRILNNLEYDISNNKQDVSILEQKTMYISDHYHRIPLYFLVI